MRITLTYIVKELFSAFLKGGKWKVKVRKGGLQKMVED